MESCSYLRKHAGILARTLGPKLEIRRDQAEWTVQYLLIRISSARLLYAKQREKELHRIKGGVYLRDKEYWREDHDTFVGVLLGYAAELIH